MQGNINITETQIETIIPKKLALYIIGDRESFHTFSQLFSKHYFNLFSVQHFPDVFVGVSFGNIFGHNVSFFDSLANSEKLFTEEAIKRIPSIKGVLVDHEANDWGSLLHNLHSSIQNKTHTPPYDMIAIIRADTLMFFFPDLLDIAAQVGLAKSKIYSGRVSTFHPKDLPYVLWGDIKTMDSLAVSLKESSLSTLFEKSFRLIKDDRVEGMTISHLDVKIGHRNYKKFQVINDRGEKKEVASTSGLSFSLRKD